MNIKKLFMNFLDYFLMAIKGQRPFMGEEGERFVPRHSTRRIDKSAPVDFGGFYRFVSQFAYGKSILDVGCGYGYGVEYLMREGASYCVGVDCSSKAIKFAKKTYTNPNLHYHVMDAANLSYFKDRDFDVVLSIETVEHLLDPQKHILEIRRIMKVGGIFVLSTPNKEMTSIGQRSLGKFHTREFYYEELRSLLNEYFAEVIIFENLMISPFEEGQKRKQLREKRGDIGYAWSPEVKTEHMAINCRYLYSHSHSFVAVCYKES